MKVVFPEMLRFPSKWPQNISINTIKRNLGQSGISVIFTVNGCIQISGFSKRNINKHKPGGGVLQEII